MTARRLFHFIVILSLGLALAGCERQKIGDITADPGRFRDKEVNVAGKVTQSFGALQWGAYEIDDGTGKMWVISEKRGVPSKGAMVGVKGRVTPTITFMGRNFATAMRESDRKAAE
jgi:hypothetical protein